MNRVGILVGALGVVILVAWLSGVFSSEYSTVDVPEWSLNLEEVEEISLRTASDTLTFSLRNDRWRISVPFDAATDSVRLSGFLRDLEDVRFGSVVSTSVERHSRYGVDSTAKSIRIRTTGGTKEMIVGNTGADYRTVYLRLVGDDRVFGSEGRIDVDATIDNWRDRTIITVPGEAILRATVEQAESAYTVVRSPSAGWELEESGSTTSADSTAVDRWVRRFSPLKGNRFSTTDAFSAAAPVARITFETVGGSSQSLEIRETETELVVQRPGSSEVLTVSAGMKSPLVPEASTLLPNR